jgi:hypothetical protein
MKKIAFVTNSATHCGIHQYGRAVHRVLSASDKFEYKFTPTIHEFHERDKIDKRIWTRWLVNMDCDAILYNHCHNTMNWLDEEVVAHVTRSGKPQFLITGHDIFSTIPGITHHFVTNPMFENTSTHSALLRPLLLDHDLQYQPPGETVKVGTFGLAYTSKNLPLLVRYVNESFPPSQKVELNIHATVGKYVLGSRQHIDRAIATCRAFAAGNVTINFTTEFIESLDDVMTMLHNNDINVFVYSDEPNRFAVSSAFDLALSARKPIVISDSSMFAHARHVKDIVIDTMELQYSTGKQINWIPDILNLGMAPVQEFYERWAPSKFIDNIEQKINL